MTERDDFHVLIGSRIVEWRDGLARVSLELAPRLMNRSGILHGGVLLTLLDEVGSLCGLWCSVQGNRRASVTVDLDCRFTGPSQTGVIVATGELVSHGRSLYFARSEVVDGTGRVLGYGSSSHKWRRGSEAVEGLASP